MGDSKAPGRGGSLAPAPPARQRRKGRLGARDVEHQAEAFAAWFRRQNEYKMTTAVFVAWAESKDFLLEDRGAVLLRVQNLLGWTREVS